MIDELIEKLEDYETTALLSAANFENNKRFHEGRAAAYVDLQLYIKDNRPTLEAGMRGTLQFKLGKSWSGELYAIADLNGEIVHRGGSVMATFKTKESCHGFAERLGMTAEFVEESDD